MKREPAGEHHGASGATSWGESTACGRGKQGGVASQQRDRRAPRWVGRSNHPTEYEHPRRATVLCGPQLRTPDVEEVYAVGSPFRGCGGPVSHYPAGEPLPHWPRRAIRLIQECPPSVSFLAIPSGNSSLFLRHLGVGPALGRQTRDHLLYPARKKMRHSGHQPVPSWNRAISDTLIMLFGVPGSRPVHADRGWLLGKLCAS